MFLIWFSFNMGERIVWGVLGVRRFGEVVVGV